MGAIFGTLFPEAEDQPAHSHLRVFINTQSYSRQSNSETKHPKDVGPPLIYNEEYLTRTMGECSICLCDLAVGELVARLPCLCIYHKECIDLWFKKRRVCPDHPTLKQSYSQNFYFELDD